MLQTKTRRPVPRVRMAGNMAWITRSAPRVLSWKSRSTSARGTPSIGARMISPALLTSTSMSPASRTAWSTLS